VPITRRIICGIAVKATLVAEIAAWERRSDREQERIE